MSLVAGFHLLSDSKGEKGNKVGYGIWRKHPPVCVFTRRIYSKAKF